MAMKQLISAIFFVLFLLLAGNASSSDVEPIYAGWTVGNSWDDGSGTSYGTILRSTDSGETWTHQGDGQIADADLRGVVDPGLAAGTQSRIVHVVLIWLKEHGDSDQRTQLIEATRSFSEIPGVEKIRVGVAIPGQRSIVDDSFDVGLYIVFSSKEALEAYLAHPKHRDAQRSILKPLSKKVIIYDFSDDGT
jgi:hypothetical protein